jgi:hypothetical protein
MKPFLNLLPLVYRRRQLLRRSLVKWSGIWAACAAVSCGACWFAWQRSQLLLRTAAATERNAAPVESLVTEQAAIRAALQAFDAKGTVLGRLRSRRPLLSLMAVVSSSARRCEGRLVVQHLAFDRKDEPNSDGSPPSHAAAPPNPTPPKNDSWGSVTIRGDAVDNLAVATFVVGLRDSGLFRNVELKSCLRAPTPGRPIRTYLLECDL